jgi:DNA polymerase (family 10)
MLDQLAALATIRGDGAEAKLFSNASVLTGSRQITSDADLGPLLDDPPADSQAEMLTRLRYMYEAGGWVLLESAIADLPADLRWLFESGAVTLEQLTALHHALGVTSAADLRAAVISNAIGSVPGLDAAVEAAVASALPTLRATIPRIPLGRASSIADPVLATLRQSSGVEWAEPAGSLRRGQDTVGDIELVASAANPSQAFARIRELPEIMRCLHQGPERLYVLIDRVQVGVRCSPPERAGATLLHLTGSADHFDALRGLAVERNWTLDPAGLARGSGAPPVAATEEEIYAALDLAYVPPEIRDGREEIAAARNGSLPRFISREDIRGDLHMHTHWSDGRDSTELMVQASVELGYEYIAITDHSPHSGASRNLSADGVKRQADEIAALRERYPQITILHGCEADILADGRLDFNDKILERLDIVLASLHEGGGDTPDRLMRRYLTAMKHPAVTVITHPTNRLVPYRMGYDLDYDRLFAAAVETQTVVEIDGAPAHLDLDGALARRAIAAGALVVIDSDSHRAEALERQMRLGILTARRGWVEPRHVLNTRPIGEIRARIAAKRAG